MYKRKGRKQETKGLIIFALGMAWLGEVVGEVKA
jgi:hypothetical protein